MVALVSCESPLSPRLTNVRQTFSRRSRRVEYSRNGSTAERVLSTAPLALMPRDSAAAASAARVDAGRPSKSRSASRTSQCSFSSASSACENRVYRPASSWLIAASRVLAVVSRLAPARTKSVCSSHVSRCCSASSPAWPRWA